MSMTQTDHEIAAEILRRMELERKRRARLRENSSPILFITDYISKTDTLAGYGAGCDDFTGKDDYTVVGHN